MPDDSERHAPNDCDILLSDVIRSHLADLPFLGMLQVPVLAVRLHWPGESKVTWKDTALRIRSIVVIPTYNEREIVCPLVETLVRLPLNLAVLIVDDM